MREDSSRPIYQTSLKYPTTTSMINPLHLMSIETIRSERPIAISRKEQVENIRQFAQVSRKQLQSLPEKLRLSVEAIAESQRLADKMQIESLTSHLTTLKAQLDTERSEKLALQKEVRGLRSGLRTALDTINQRDRFIAEFRKTEMVQAVMSDLS